MGNRDETRTDLLMHIDAIDLRLAVLDKTICHRLNGIESQLKRIADALDAQTPPPQKLYELNVNVPFQETEEEEQADDVESDGEWVDVDEAAQRCGVTRVAVYRWVKSDRIRHKRSVTGRSRTLVDIDTVPAKYREAAKTDVDMSRVTYREIPEWVLAKDIETAGFYTGALVTGQYDLMIRSKEDPDRSERPKGGRKDKAPHRTWKKKSVADVKDKILAHMRSDHYPRTLNRISVELWDQNAVITSNAPPCDALRELVEEGLVAWGWFSAPGDPDKKGAIYFQPNNFPVPAKGLHWFDPRQTGAAPCGGVTGDHWENQTSTWDPPLPQNLTNEVETPTEEK